jgi:murein tripeptide amidase MpaA
LFPEHGEDAEKRPHKFSSAKKTIFLSARVHPGETPSSFVLNGILDTLISGKKHSKQLLKQFVFKIIPLINPDGVARGYY